tara:strand:- start:13348 stop:13623 length:276 start_codon:yes stop_codon:yes gene_type:complete
MMKDLRKTEEYKKAYERVDRLCKYMPHLIKDMVSPENEPQIQKQAFEDRIQLFKKENAIPIKSKGLRKLSRFTPPDGHSSKAPEKSKEREP